MNDFLRTLFPLLVVCMTVQFFWLCVVAPTYVVAIERHTLLKYTYLGAVYLSVLLVLFLGSTALFFWPIHYSSHPDLWKGISGLFAFAGSHALVQLGRSHARVARDLQNIRSLAPK